MGIRREQREKRQREILGAALDLFAEKGYTGTKIRDIADRVEMSTGLLFHYFPSKAKLCEELVRYGTEGPLTVLEADESNPLGYFEELAAFMLSALRENSFVAKLFAFMAQVHFTSTMPESVRELASSRAILEQSVSLMKKGQEMGQIRSGDPLALAVLFWQSLSGVALYAAKMPGTPLPEGEWIIDSIRKNDK